MRFFLAIAGTLVATGAQAATYHAGSDCAPLEAHTPRPDIEARPGYDHKGNQVVSPDLTTSTIDTEALKHPNIALDIPMAGYVDQDKYNADLSRTDIQVGQLKVGEQGEVKLNDQILSTGQQAVYPKECK